MNQTLDIRLSPEAAHDDTAITAELARKAQIQAADIQHFRIIKRSIDARGKHVVFQLRVMISDQPIQPQHTSLKSTLRPVGTSPEVMIIGAVLVLLFGHRLPEVMRSLGQGLNIFRKELSE